MHKYNTNFQILKIFSLLAVKFLYYQDGRVSYYISDREYISSINHTNIDNHYPIYPQLGDEYISITEKSNVQNGLLSYTIYSLKEKFTEK